MKFFNTSVLKQFYLHLNIIKNAIWIYGFQYFYDVEVGLGFFPLFDTQASSYYDPMTIPEILGVVLKGGIQYVRILCKTR